ncbi:MAG TPA: class I SAM-dependent methyltransferase [Baekduia sp.]|uniref:class I SAM-dependent methyltransferase n=1 Tax=Baekduia sp. TaxID=2600305 RepID=UPI002C9D5800|nr:class I SAM-dependent methyltransferase [Baekduia sp.]HMJ32506.1 class I SAM-dependent methyltransferase [Baekduia sp.]
MDDDDSGPAPRPQPQPAPRLQPPREWDAGSYQVVSTPHQGWGAEILDRLPLRGDETVLDLGCGTGRVTAQLLERLPRGRVVGIDGSAAMVAEAQRLLGSDRATFRQADLVAFTVDEPADAALSSATFHWIADHDALFPRIRAALKPGAPFVAQCGGRGNIATVVAAVLAVSAREPFAAALGDWPGPWNFAGPEETRRRLERAGFAVERVWLQDSPKRPQRLREFLRTVSLGSHLECLPQELRDPFLDAVVVQLGPDPVHDYVRLNIVARAG